MGYPITHGQTARPLVFFMEDNASEDAGKTGLSPTVVISKNGASFASPAGAVSEIGNGFYKVAGNATDAGTVGPLHLYATGSGALPCHEVYTVVDADPYVLFYGTATAGTTSSITLDNDTPAWFGVNTYELPYGCIVRMLSGTGAGQWSYANDYTSGTKVLAFQYAVHTAPASGTRYAIMAPVGRTRLMDVSVGGGTVDPEPEIIQAAVWGSDDDSYEITPGLNPSRALAIAACGAAVGVTSNAGPGPRDIVLKDPAGGSTLATISIDSSGNRTDVVFP